MPRPTLTLVPARENNNLSRCYDSFLIDRQAMRCTPATLGYYRYALGHLLEYLESCQVLSADELTASHIRAFFVTPQDKGLADTTVHIHARAVKTFCRWLSAEGHTSANPFERVKMPRLDKKTLPALAAEDVKRLLDSCQRNRDKAIILSLVDSGARAAEFCALDFGDLDMRSGSLAIRQGKGRKDRVTFLGAKSRKCLLKYLGERGELSEEVPLFATLEGTRLTPNSLFLLLRRLGDKTGVTGCSPHTFQRTFALWSLRAGMNIYALQQIMGHSDLTMLQRYLALVKQDLQAAHEKYGAVDNMLPRR